MSRLFTLIAVLILTTACSTKKMMYVASTLTDCKNSSSEKCLQVKENMEDEWTVLNNGIEGFEYKDGFLQKIEVSIRKNKKINASSRSYKFVKLIYEQEEKLETVMDVPFSLILDKNHTKKWQVTTMMGLDSLATHPTLIFKEGQVSGYAGCNNYGATFTLNGNEITFDLVNATKRYCTNMKIEKTYFDCLSKIKTYKLLNTKVSFYDATNAELISCIILE